MLELIFNISNVGYLFLNDVKNGAVIWVLLFKGYQALSLWLNIILIRGSFSFVQKHFLGIILNL